MSDRWRLVALAIAIGTLAFMTAIAASWPWERPPGDPRWELIRERAAAATRGVEQRRRRGITVSQRLLQAEIELEAELAKEEAGDLEAAGRALHSLEQILGEERGD